MNAKFILIICLIAIFTGVVTTFVLNKTEAKKTQPPITKSENSIIAECTTHIEGHVHYHAQLTITVFGKNFPIPANAGIDDGCMHPLHTHDTSGEVHIDYYKPYPFTIGDFFTTWGMIFNRYQLGNLLSGGRYTIQIRINKKGNSEFEKYVIKDNDNIEIVVSNKK